MSLQSLILLSDLQSVTGKSTVLSAGFMSMFATLRIFLNCGGTTLLKLASSGLPMRTMMSEPAALRFLRESATESRMNLRMDLSTEKHLAHFANGRALLWAIGCSALPARTSRSTKYWSFLRKVTHFNANAVVACVILSVVKAIHWQQEIRLLVCGHQCLIIMDP